MACKRMARLSHGPSNNELSPAVSPHAWRAAMMPPARQPRKGADTLAARSQQHGAWSRELTLRRLKSSIALRLTATIGNGMAALHKKMLSRGRVCVPLALIWALFACTVAQAQISAKVTATEKIALKYFIGVYYANKIGNLLIKLEPGKQNRNFVIARYEAISSHG